ncbi:MAG TPA: galactose-1-phosphate uridylyltransferase [bacterium]|nr:galactose-1-phosphate uridylyltransferase [bacterium]
MSELRLNVISNEWVIIATERATRPHDFAAAAAAHPTLPAHRADCPFCPGNEQLATAEICRTGGSGRAWRTRVVPNKFPALQPAGTPERKFDGVFRSISGVGIHEVIIEHPRHDAVMALMSAADIVEILQVYRTRYRIIQDDPRVAAITVFKNHGARAGTSLEHPHSQLIATPVVPPQARVRLERAMRYYDEFGACVVCQMLAQELAAGERVLVASDYFVSFIPYAALSPFHTWIFPRRHCASFADAADSELQDLAVNLKTYLGKLYHGLHNPDFNLTIRSLPGFEHADYQHWYVSVVPRVSNVAGFELGSGIFVNTALPEHSAAFLRGVTVPD